jgi:hypothetical protein
LNDNVWIDTEKRKNQRLTNRSNQGEEGVTDLEALPYQQSEPSPCCRVTEIRHELGLC